MRTALSIRTLSAGAIATLIGPVAASQAAAIYTTNLNSYSVTASFAGNGTGAIGLGDDYDLGGTGATLTGLSFYGGLTTTSSQLTIDFFNTSGVRVARIFPSASEVSGFALHTLSSGDFMQNGVTGVPIPSVGYVIFSPYSYDTVSVNGVIPGNPNPAFSLAGGVSAPTVGSSSSTLSAHTTPDPTTGLAVLSTGAFVPPAGTSASPQFFAFSLQGTVLPEPASLSLIAPIAGIALRRRRSSRA